jgi:hypothetical protein
VLQAAVFHHQLAMSAGTQRLVMGNNHQCDATPIEFFEQTNNLFASVAVKIAGRLVGQYQRRLHDGGAGNRHALALTAGQLIRTMVGAVFQTKILQRLRHPAPPFGSRDPRKGHRQRDVFSRIQARDEMEALKYKTNPRAAHSGLLVGR